MLFDNTISGTRIKLRKIAKSLSSEIRECLQRDEVLEAMAIVNPRFWYVPTRIEENAMRSIYHGSLIFLIKYFSKTT